MRKTRRTQPELTDAELRSAVEALPGGWTVRPIMGLRIRLRWVARREVPEVDDEGEASTTLQWESAVDAEDLIERLHRRNVSLGLETPAKREEVALSA